MSKSIDETEGQDGAVNAAMALLARQSRGLTQQELAEHLGVTQAALSRLEAGLRPPSRALLERLACVLDYPVEFFFQRNEIYGFDTSILFHRKRQSVPVRTLDKIHANINILRINVARMLDGVEIENVNFPRVDLADFDGQVEDVARAVRAQWHLPRGPVMNLTAAIEEARGIVILYDFTTTLIDAMSGWVPRTPPLFFVRGNVPGDRLRFSLCHELGHVILHSGDLRPDMEKEADRFAAEFLMPEREIRPYLLNVSLQKLAELKPYWKVSMAALLKRAQDLGTITARHARSLWMRMSGAGYKTREPLEVDIPPEVPTFYDEIVDIYRRDFSYTPSELGHLFKLHEHEVRRLYYASSATLRLVN